MTRVWSLLLCVLLLLPAPLWAAIAYVQSKDTVTDGTGATTIAATFTSNVTAGNLLAVFGNWGTADTTAGCTDSMGNAYTEPEQFWNANVGGTIMCYALANSTGANTVTVTFGASVGFRGICILEYSGVKASGPLDTFKGTNFQSNPGSGANAITTGNFTVANNNSLIVARSVIAALSSSYTAGTNYTGREDDNASTTTADHMCEDRLGVSAGTHAATWTNGTTGVGTNSGAMVFIEETGATPRNLMLLGVGP